MRRSVMRWIAIIAVALLAVVGFTGCDGVVVAEDPDPARSGPSVDTESFQGALLLAPFKRDLTQALLAGMARSPIEALTACRTRAPEIADALSQGGVRLGRTSHRLRNPANASPDWVRPILNAYLADPSHAAPRSVSLPEGRTGYVEPIRMQPLCLTCHGERLAPEVAARIAELYPEDRAVGFDVGDVRGVFWVDYPR